MAWEGDLSVHLEGQRVKVYSGRLGNPNYYFHYLDQGLAGLLYMESIGVGEDNGGRAVLDVTGEKSLHRLLAFSAPQK